MGHRRGFNRRDFLKLTGVGVAGATLASCKRESGAVELTAVPPPAATGVPALSAETASAVEPLVAGEVADSVLVNGNILTMDGNRSKVSALAIKDGLVRLVGDEQAARAAVGGATKLIDLGGRTVTPGMIDAHCHLGACGLLGTAYLDVSWPAVYTIEQLQTKLAGQIAAIPKAAWVVGSGWVTFDGRAPNKHDLDPVSPNNPVMLISQSGHMAVVNSLALEMAGINASTKDPGAGLFLREANNEPSGTIMNHPAMDMIRKLWPPELLSQEVMDSSALAPQAKFASMGVTSFCDNYARPMDRVKSYFDAARGGKMTIRGTVMNVLEYAQELDGRIADLEAMRFENDFMHFAGAKFQLDGALEASFTHEPHNGVTWNMTIWKPRDLNEAVQAFHDAGYQVSIHTAGDAAVDMALDAIENAMQKNPRPDPRHRIEHSVLNTNAAFQRQKDLGVIISTQPTLITAFGEICTRVWGEERAQRMIPTRTWLDMGIPLALSSDAPSMPWWDPQSTLAASILRLTVTKKSISPAQAMTLDEALYAHTMGSAYAEFAEAKKGSLEIGKFADLIVWHDDPHSVEPIEILDLTIDMTMVGGNIVHQA